MQAIGRRSMAEQLELSQSMVSRVWWGVRTAPQQDSCKLSKNPLFVAKVGDLVGLYLNLPERAMVLCVDEKTQIQAHNRTAPVFRMLPGTFGAGQSGLRLSWHLKPVRRAGSGHGKVIGSLHSRHRSREFLAFLEKVDAKVLADLDCYVVLDNASTHKPRAALADRPPASSCSSRRPVHPGSTWSNAGSLR